MSAKIGILGEGTTATAGSTTGYTVPADKAARIRIKFQFEAGTTSDSRIRVRIGSPGSENQMGWTWTTNLDLWTGLDPADDVTVTGAGVRTHLNMGDTLVGTANVNFAPCYPLMADYYLSTGDTVIYQIVSNAFDDVLFQVIGVEDDA